MRALLDRMRENKARVQEFSANFALLLKHESHHLAILNPEVGDEKLIQAVAAALAKPRS